MPTPPPVLTILFPDDPEPSGLTELQERVHTEIRLGRRAALRIAVLVAHARDAYFPQAPAEWLEWAMGEFGYGERHCFSCLKVGRLLSRPELRHVAVEALTECDIQKLELLATLPPAQLPQFVERVHPDQLTRDELRDKVKLFKDPDEAVPCEKCGEAFVPKKDGETVCPVCCKGAGGKSGRAPATPEAAFERAVMAVQTALDSRSPEVLDMCTHPASVRIGLKIVAEGLARLRQDSWWTPEQYEMIGAVLAELVQTLDDVRTAAGAVADRKDA